MNGWRTNLYTQSRSRVSNPHFDYETHYQQHWRMEKRRAEEQAERERQEDIEAIRKGLDPKRRGASTRHFIGVRVLGAALGCFFIFVMLLIMDK